MEIEFIKTHCYFTHLSPKTKVSLWMENECKIN